MNFKNTFLAAALLAAPAIAQAQPVNGLYVGAGVGANFLDKTNFSGTWDSPAIRLEGEGAEFSWGYVGVLSLGWGFGNGLRAEIEGSYRQNATSSSKASNQTYSSGANGNASSYGAMVNILYDIDLGNMLGGITPYVGAGVGYIWHHYSDVGNRTSDTDNNFFNGTSGAFGAQAIAGLSLPISAVPGLAMTAEYRFMMTAGHTMEATPIKGPNIRLTLTWTTRITPFFSACATPLTPRPRGLPLPHRWLPRAPIWCSLIGTRLT
jgi:opacity protein-like surface antigen